MVVAVLELIPDPPLINTEMALLTLDPDVSTWEGDETGAASTFPSDAGEEELLLLL